MSSIRWLNKTGTEIFRQTDSCVTMLQPIKVLQTLLQVLVICKFETGVH